MLHAFLRSRGPLVGFGLVALVTTGSFAWAVTSRFQVARISGERDAALAELAQMKEASGQLAELNGRLASARMEYGKVVQGWAEARGKLGSTQQELAGLTKRLDLARERAQTGSIRPSEPQKPKPAR